MELAEASYGNTIGAPHDDISLSVLASFEDYWQQNEIEGDLRLDSKIGMYGVVQRLVEEIATDDRLSIKLNWNVTKVFPENAKVRVYSSTEEHLEADAVIMTVPPPVLSSIDVDLGPAKRQALQYIGMNKAMKVLLLFQEPIWPSNVQSVICGGCPVPEMWFKHGGDSYIATGFITSPKADDFLALCNHDPHQAASIMLQQLSTASRVAPASVGLWVHVPETKHDHGSFACHGGTHWEYDFFCRRSHQYQCMLHSAGRCGDRYTGSQTSAACIAGERTVSCSNRVEC
jgi:hypothetical protein